MAKTKRSLQSFFFFFAFCGLYNVFIGMERKKNRELKWNEKCQLVIILMVAPFEFELYPPHPG